MLNQFKFKTIQVYYADVYMMSTSSFSYGGARNICGYTICISLISHLSLVAAGISRIKQVIVYTYYKWLPIKVVQKTLNLSRALQKGYYYYFFWCFCVHSG